MAEPSGEPTDAPDEPASRLDAALEAFKQRDGDADTNPVSESGRPRLNWDPVTEAGSTGTTDAPPRSSFQFDLGGALARLGGAGAPPETGADDRVDDPGDEPVEPLPVRGRHETGSDDPSEPSSEGSSEGAGPLPVRGRETQPEDPSGSEGSSEVPSASEGAEPLPVRGRETEGSSPGGSVPPLPVRGDAGSGGSSEPERVEPLPVRGRAAPDTPTSDAGPPEPLPTRRPAAGDEPAAARVVDRLPSRSARPAPTETSTPTPTPTPTPASPPAPERVSPAAAKRSVFDEATPAPTLPAAGGPTLPPQQPVVPAAPAAVSADLTGLPTLPASTPAAPPPVVAPIESAPSTPEINALRSAQLRAKRNQRQGKLLTRAVLAFVVVGAVVAAALVFGRSYLFPTEWNAELTPLVDAVQSERGVEFDHTISLVERPTTEYGPVVTEQVFGPDWTSRLPEWRALGLAGGDGSIDDVQARVTTLFPAYYDEDADQIVAAAGVPAETRAPALRLALEAALAQQLGIEPDPAPSRLGLTGLDDPGGIARRAVDATATGVAGSAPDAVVDLTGVPAPVAYQLRAIDELGAALVGDTEVRWGDPLPDAVAQLDDGARSTVGGLRQPGDQQVLEPVALGADDWLLIWGARVPPVRAGRLADALVADSYSVVSRSGTTCFIAVFRTASDAAGTAMVTDLGAWAAAAPDGAAATVTQLGPDRVQLEACDPGPDAAVASGVGSVDSVLARQLARLGS